MRKGQVSVLGTTVIGELIVNPLLSNVEGRNEATLQLDLTGPPAYRGEWRTRELGWWRRLFYANYGDYLPKMPSRRRQISVRSTARTTIDQGHPEPELLAVPEATPRTTWSYVMHKSGLWDENQVKRIDSCTLYSTRE